jgi:DNA (cytosine-5)-methyltransferase 1
MTFVPDVSHSLTGAGFDASEDGTGRGTPIVPQLIRKVRTSEWVEDTTGSTLAARDYKDSGDVVVVPNAFRKSRRPQSDDDAETWVQDGEANTLNTFDSGETRTTHIVIEPPDYGVRRLTPVECERLQAFPDGWTEPAGSDSARYKALGNAVTVNTVRWVLGRMLEQS